MRVLVVTTGLQVGGAEQALLALVRGLIGRGTDVHVVSLTGLGAVGEQMKDDGIAVTALRSPYNPVRIVSRLSSLIDAHGPSLVQTWMYHANILGGIAARRRGLRVVWGIRATDMLPNASLSTRMAVHTGRLTSRLLPAKIVYCAHSARLLHERSGYPADRGVVISNGVSVPSILASKSTARHQHGLRGPAPVVGRIGRWHDMKDWPSFFRAIALMTGEFRNLRVLAAGPGVTEDNVDLQQLLTETGMRQRTTMLGSLDDPVAFYRACDVVISSSAWGEGFPNVVAESLAAGTPVVASDVGDSARIVGDPAYIVPPRDPAALAEATMALLRMPVEAREELGRRQRERMETTYSPEVMVDEYVKVYRAVSGDR